MNCEFCDGVFERQNRKGPAPRFCSSKCRHKAWLGKQDEEYWRREREREASWRDANPAKKAMARDQWKRDNHERLREAEKKRRAHQAVYLATCDGRLTREPCECGEADTEAHHDDYSKPLDVRWLCKPCHADLHRRYERHTGQVRV